MASEKLQRKVLKNKKLSKRLGTDGVGVGFGFWDVFGDFYITFLLVLWCFGGFLGGFVDFLMVFLGFSRFVLGFLEGLVWCSGYLTGIGWWVKVEPFCFFGVLSFVGGGGCVLKRPWSSGFEEGQVDGQYSITASGYQDS